MVKPQRGGHNYKGNIMALAKKDYFWNKLKKARKEMQKRFGDSVSLEISVAELNPDVSANQPIDIVGFDSPQQMMKDARAVELTGAGENGIIEPNNPVALLDTTTGPAMIHEGEALVQPDNSPANTRAVLSNEQLNELEQRYNMPGFFGGSQGIQPTYVNQNALRQLENRYGTQGYQRSSRRRGARGYSGTVTPDLGTNNVNTEPVPPQEENITNTTTPNITTPTFPLGVNPNQGNPFEVPQYQADQVQYPQREIDTAATEQALGTATYQPPTPDLATQQITEQVTGTGFYQPPEPDLATQQLTEQVTGTGFYEPPTPDLATLEAPTTSEIDIDAPEWVSRFESQYGQGIAEGYSQVRDIARGESPYFKSIVNNAIQDLAANQAYARAARQQQYAAQGISPSQAAALEAVAQRDESNARAQLASDLATQKMQMQEGAAGDLVQLGIQAQGAELALRKYGDEAFQRMAQDVAAGMGWETFQQKYPGATLEDFNGIQAAERLATTGPIDPANRLNMLFSSGMSFADIKNDETYRQAISTETGLTGDALDNEIDTRISSYINSPKNKAVFGGNMTSFINDIVTNMGSGEDARIEVINNPTIRQNAAAYRGLDHMDPDPIIQQSITEEIEKRWNARTLSEEDYIYQTLTDTGFFDEFMDQEVFEPQFKEFISEAYRNGLIDSDGNWVGDERGLYPWQDPVTYFDYTDWNGNNIVAGEEPSSDTLVKVLGNGDTFFVGTKTDKRPVAFADMDAAWNTVGVASRVNYFDEDGNFLIEDFMSDYFSGKAPEGGTTKDFFELQTVFRDPSTGIGTNMTLDRPSNEMIPSTMLPTTTSAGTTLDPLAGRFWYWDSDSNVFKDTPSNGDLAQTVWQNFSDYFRPSLGSDEFYFDQDTNMLTADGFEALYGDGTKFRVDKFGNVRNFQPEFKGQINSLGHFGYGADVSNPVTTPADINFSENLVKMRETTRYINHGNEGGIWEYKPAYNTDIYNKYTIKGHPTQEDVRVATITFKPRVKEFFEKNTGKWIMINGQQVKVLGIVSGHIHKKHPEPGTGEGVWLEGDMLRVEYPNGTTGNMNFGSVVYGRDDEDYEWDT